MTSADAPAPWWRDAVVYQIYPRSFADTDGDGIGDLGGIAAHLDHLAWLGVDAVWLSPVYPSPMADAGYDVADYCDVDPLFGTLADLDALVAAAHDRGLKVLLDWVPNHTSDQHPWFVESRSSRTSPKRDWYVWHDVGPDGELPNNWLSAFTDGAPAWTVDEATGQCYLHQFLPQQPDLNWDHPDVVAAMHDTLRFWLDRGVDGFRVDVVHGLGRDLDRDDPPELAGLPHCSLNDSERTHPLIEGIRRVIDEYPDRLLLGEVFLLSTERMARYVRPGELHLAFNFPFPFAPWDAAALRERIERTHAEHDPIGAWPTWVLSNHDLARHRTRYGGSEARARAAAVLLLTLRGTPFVYQGEELGLEDAVVAPQARVDPGGRDGCRAPLPWTTADGHGWPATPWLPFPPQAAAHSAEAQQADEASILHLYRRLLALRHEEAALRRGTFTWLPEVPDGVLGYERAVGDDRWWVLVSAADATRSVALPGPADVVVASDGATGPFTGVVRPDQGLVLRPRA